MLWRPWDRGGRFGWMELNPADVEVLLEAVGLEEVGEFQGPDIPAALPDFTLEVADDPLDIALVESRLEKLVPQALPIKAQAQALACQLAVPPSMGTDPLHVIPPGAMR